MPNRRHLNEVSLWFIEELPYDVVWIDRTGHIIFANESFCNSLGYSKTEMEGLTMFDVNPGLAADKWERHWEIVRQKGVDHFKTTHRKKRGETYMVEVFSLFFSNNGKNLICAIVRDITETQFYKTILEETEKAVQVGGWKWNLAEGSILASEETLCIFGLKEAEGLLPAQIIHHFVDQGLARDALSRCVQEGIPYDLNLQIRDTGQQLKWVRCIGKPVVRDGKTEKILGTYQDITRQKEQELALVNALNEIKLLQQQLEAEKEYLQEEINREYHFENIICQSKEYARVLQQAVQVAPTDTTVLITGESGTGKELLARAVHESSRRKERPLIKVNCAALPKELIESELFGHKKGAFTGALTDKAGKFELADKGTLFLDEIGELPLELQPKLLRVLQEGEFDRLGDTAITRVDVRIIAATNRDLELLIKDGAFREDLYYRLNVFPIHSIPLRERREDIPLLARYFLEKYAPKAGKHFKGISKKAVDSLLQYDFPGNVRELENLIERAVILENGPTLSPGSWMPVNKPGLTNREKLPTFEAMQREHILKALFQTGWRVSGKKGAARILGLKDKTLFAKMKKLGIQKEDYLKR